MKKKIIVFGIVSCLVGLISFAYAEYAHIGLDVDFDDWANISKVSDPIGDDVSPKAQDIAEVAIANNEINLYFYVRVDDTNDDQFGGDGNSPPYKHEELHFYLDLDNNSLTGIVVGPNFPNNVGAEFYVRTTRKGDTTPDIPEGTNEASGQTSLHYAFGGFWYEAGWNTHGAGIPNPQTVMTGGFPRSPKWKSVLQAGHT